MSMRIGKVLVVVHDEKIRQAAEEILLGGIRQAYDIATSLTEALELIAINNYVAILMSCEFPTSPGGDPRRQNAENLVDESDRLKGEFKPPVVCLLHKMADQDKFQYADWIQDMTIRGVVKFVPTPFRKAGKTPDRSLKKILDGQYIRLVHAKSKTAGELMAGPSRATADVADGGKAAGQANVIAEIEGSAIKKMIMKVMSGDALRLADLAASRRPAKPSQMDSNIMPLEPLPDQAPNDDDDVPSVVAKANPAPVPAHWAGIPNDVVTIDEFLLDRCGATNKRYRINRKKALLTAARHSTVTMPPQAQPHKQGHANRYFVHDLLSAWQGFSDAGVELPPVVPVVKT